MAGTDKTQDVAAQQVDTPYVILVEPQLGQNIGMVARAMLNSGWNRLRLVKPRDGWPSTEAAAASSGALSVIENAELFETTAEAVADLQRVYATTARLRDMTNRVLTPKAAAPELLSLARNDVKTGILFGPERTGLTNDDVTLSDTIIEVPLNPSFKSLNLSQAVLLVAYEWFQLTVEGPDERLEFGDTNLAEKASVLNFLNRFITALEEGGFFKSPNMKPVMIRNIHNMFQRVGLTEQEIRTLHGCVEALKRWGKKNP
ncbi:MAG: RNA methyltransferase [Alphaproteobacteria bacterium]